MPGSPTLSSGRVNPLLTNVLLAYTNASFLADMIIPTVPGLKEEAGKIPELGVSHLRQYSSKRSLYDESDHRINYDLNIDKTYQVDYYDESVYVPDRLQEQLQKPFDAKQAAAFTAKNALMLEREIALATLLTATATLTQNTTLSGTSQWDDTVNSNPDQNIDTGREAILAATGRYPNGVVLNYKVANAMQRHPFFLEIALRSLAGGVAKPTVLSKQGLIDTLKAWYGFKYVLIGEQIYVNSKQGQTVTKTNVWGNDFVMFYRPEGPSLFEPSFAYSFQLAGKNLKVKERRHTNDKGNIIECEWAYQDNILDVNSAYLIKAAI